MERIEHFNLLPVVASEYSPDGHMMVRVYTSRKNDKFMELEAAYAEGGMFYCQFLIEGERCAYGWISINDIRTSVDNKLLHDITMTLQPHTSVSLAFPKPIARQKGEER